MKTIGMIGGMSWESTAAYYQIINEAMKEELGGFHSAKCLLYSVDFHEMEAKQTKGDWDGIASDLVDITLGLQKAGADFLVICANTMHKLVPQIQAKVDIPILHIADAVAEALKAQDIRKAALLGTIYTMEQDFYKDRIASHGIEVLVPEAEDRTFINHVIFQELCLGILSDSSRERFVDIIGKLNRQGAEGIILGCTEIGLLVKQADTSVPLFDTTVIHARRAAQFALAK